MSYFGYGYFWHLTEGGCTHEVVDGLPLKGEPAGFVWHQTITLSAADKNKQQCSHKILKHKLANILPSILMVQKLRSASIQYRFIFNVGKGQKFLHDHYKQCTNHALPVYINTLLWL